MEPVLEQFRPAILSSLTFSKLTLGTVSPNFTGINWFKYQVIAALETRFSTSYHDLLNLKNLNAFILAR